jgi:hypothetical protein
MTLFGKSLFETVLAGIDARQEEEDEADDPSEPVIRGLNGGFVGRSFHGDHVADADPAAQFENFVAEREPEPVAEAPEPKPEKPMWLNRLTDDEIAEDVGLSSALTKHQLQEKRRQFARENHPDRVSTEYQAIATLRMMVANQLIDKALKSARA